MAENGGQPQNFREFIKTGWGLVAAVYAVLNLVAFGVWAYSVIEAKQHRPLNFWLVIALAMLLVAALVWGWSQRSAGGQETGGVHHHYSAPVTWNIGTQAPTSGPAADARQPVGPSTATASREVVRLADYIERVPNRPPTIRARQFRNAVLQGPLWVGLGAVTFIRVGFGTAGDSLDSILWVLQPGERKTGIALVDNCIFEDCDTEQIGFVGSAEQIAEFRRMVPMESSDGEGHR